MSADLIGQFNRSECQAEFTYTMSRKFIKIQDTGKGSKPVAEDLEAILRKIEAWHQGSIAGVPNRLSGLRWLLGWSRVGRLAHSRFRNSRNERGCG
jgi:hypothetical protein